MNWSFQIEDYTVVLERDAVGIRITISTGDVRLKRLYVQAEQADVIAQMLSCEVKMIHMSEES